MQSSSQLPDSPASGWKRVRSTTGCSNCKKRKLKCDERKPGCSRCQIRGLPCPGYPTKGLKWSSKHELHRARPSHAPSPPDVGALIREERTAEHLVTKSESTSAATWEAMRITPMSVRSGIELRNDFVSPLSLTRSSSTTTSGLQNCPPAVKSAAEAYATSHMPAILDPPASGGDTFSLYNEDDRDESWSPSLDASSEHQITNALTSSSMWDPRTTTVALFDHTNVSRSSTASSASESVQTSSSPLNSSVIHIPTLLVEYYFQKVCRECSTFDSPLNPFRSMISKMRDTSASIDYTIQSLSASKLADDMPRMKLVGIEAQCQALETVKNECLRATALHNVSDETLCTILLLGMTTSWHVREDLGLEYLALAGRVVGAKTETTDVAAKSNLEFFQNALKYWQMIVSLVSGAVETIESESHPSLITIGPSAPTTVGQRKRIMPHPWTGISCESQELFGQVLRLIRKARVGFGKRANSLFSKARINNVSSAIAAAERLEVECWSVQIPSSVDVEDTGDPSTPPVHHVLTAKAYLLAALLHIYMIFPDILDDQIQSLSLSERTAESAEAVPDTFDSTHVISKAWLWPQRSSEDLHDTWLRDIGLRIVECLASIGADSSTRVVHPPLLLSVASALTLSREDNSVLKDHAAHHMTVSSITINSRQGTELMQDVTTDETAHRIRQCRNFVVSRLEIMQALMRFRAIDNILVVIKEVWRRADEGAQDIFWMDVMSELHCETLFG